MGNSEEPAVLSTLAQYYRALQEREGVVPRELVRPWARAEIEAVRSALRAAMRDAALSGQLVPGLSHTQTGTTRTNQSKGNIAADYVADRLTTAAGTAGVAIRSVAGPGYPDKRVILTGGFACTAEFKATSNWSPGDSNRRVLTSSSSKLRRAIARGDFPDPPCHLLVTVIYSASASTFEALRLDFLEPTTPVSVRLEASTSHRLLADGRHASSILTD